MSAEGAQIVGWGAVTALGPGALQTGFALRAGLSRVRETLLCDAFGEPLRMALLDTLAQDCAGTARLLALAAPAAREAALRIRAEARPAVVLLLAVDPGLPREQAEAVLRGVQDAVQPLLPLAGGELVLAGGAAGALALERAGEWLASGRAEIALVGGVHSDYDAARLEPLLASGRVIRGENIEGFVPGEGAAFAALTTPEVAARLRARAVAQIRGAAHAPGRGAADPRRAQVEACSAALGRAARLVRRRSDDWYVDLTHEPHGVGELQVLLARHGELVGTRAQLRAPLRELGRLGAATLPLFWALAAEAWVRGYAADDLAVCLAGSDDGTRGAVLLEAARDA